jgi:peroxiredoxin
MKKLLSLSVIIAAAVALFVAASPGVTGLKVGDTAPAFTLKNIDGKMYALKDIKDAAGNTPKGYIITFTCNTCPYAVMYEDRFIELHNKMAPKGWPVVAIQPNDPEIMPADNLEAMKKRAKEKGFPFLYLLDEGQKVYPQYGAERTPHIFLVDNTMTVRYIGALDDNAQDASAVKKKYVANAIKAVEAGETPDPSFTKAVGCTIKVKK